MASKWRGPLLRRDISFRGCFEADPALTIGYQIVTNRETRGGILEDMTTSKRHLALRPGLVKWLEAHRAPGQSTTELIVELARAAEHPHYTELLADLAGVTKGSTGCIAEVDRLEAAEVH